MHLDHGVDPYIWNSESTLHTLLACKIKSKPRPASLIAFLSSIDPKTDEIMQRVVREKFCNHTILAVAHKLDTILDFDRIVVLDGGRIVEVGEPFVLLSDSKSHFSRLYASSVAREESD